MIDKPNLSQCCNVPVKVVTNGEGGNWHECTKCGQPCDVVAEPVTGVRDPGGNVNKGNEKE